MVKKVMACAAILWSCATYAEDISQVYHFALDSDPTFKAQQSSYLADKQALPQAIGLLLPTLSANYSTTGISTDSAFTTNRNEKNWGLALSQPLYRPQFFALIEQACHVEKQAFAALAAASQDLIIRVAEQYFAILAAHDDVDFSRAQVKAFERQLEQTKQRFDVGLIAITDVNEAQARRDSAEANRIAAENNLSDQYEILREITGVPIQAVEFLKASDSTLLQAPMPNSQETWVNTAQQFNLDIEVFKEASLAAKAETSSQASSHFPTVDINAQVQKNVAAPPFNATINQRSINLSLNVPIFEGGRVTSRVKEARERYHEALNRLEIQRRSTYSQTRQRFRGVLTQISQVKSLNQAVISNRSALEAVEAAFEVGTRTVVDVLDAESDLLEAIRNYKAARYLYVLEGLRLKRAAGTLKATDISQVNALLKG